jgi:uncharacterized damage-inducible protein DinB
VKLLLESLKSSPEYLEMLLKEIPSDRLSKTYEKANWSILDHIEHLLETQEVFSERLRLFKDEKSPRIQAFVPDDAENNVTTEKNASNYDSFELINRFKKMRLSQIEYIQNLPEKIYSRKGFHSEHDIPLSFKRLLMHFISHDYYHYYRIEELGSFKEENITSW